MIELASIVQALTVSEQLSFRGAARVLGTSQSAVSRRVRALEDELGVSLFERHSGGVRPTRAGRQFLDRARRALDELDHAVKRAGDAGRGSDGGLRIGIFASIAAGFAHDLLEKYSLENPGVGIDVAEGAPRVHIANIKDRRMDIAFVTGAPSEPGCDVTTFWSERVFVALSSAHADNIGANQLSDNISNNDGTMLSEIVVTGRRLPGPNGSTIGESVIGGGINLLDGLTDFYDSNPTIAELGFSATQAILTGGPLKTIVTRAANTVLDGAVDKVSEIAAGRATSYLTGVAEDLGWETRVIVLDTQLSLGAVQIGQAGGQLTGGVVSTIMGAGILAAVSRGRSVRALFDVGPYNRMKGSVSGADAHHAGQAAGMERMVPGYNRRTAPSIILPRKGHTTLNTDGQIIDGSHKQFTNPRDLLARDIRELRRVYPNLSNRQLQELIRQNKAAYPNAFSRKR